jgi:hypothetical protein
METLEKPNSPEVTAPLFTLTLEKIEPFFKNWIQEVLQSEKPSTIPESVKSIEQPISQSDAIKFLGKSRQTLIAWRKKGIITAHILGGRVYYLKSELLTAMK